MAEEAAVIDEGASLPNKGIEIPGEDQQRNYEEIAREKGWRPKEEYNGETSDWVNAEEFVKREPLFNRIKSQSKDLKEMRKTLDAMSQHFEAQVAGQVKIKLDELNAKKKEAIELGDVAAVEKIEGEIAAEKEVSAGVAKPRGNATIDSWVAEIAGMMIDPEMKAFAIAFNDALVKNSPTMPLDESLKKTSEAVKKSYPDQFGRPKTPVDPVEGGSDTAGTSGKKYTVSRLSDDQKRVYDQMVKRNKIMTHEEYFKSLDDIGELV